MTDTFELATYGMWISKGGALLSETRILLEAWEPGETAAALARRVISTDLLGRSTAQRARDIVTRVFGPRYLSPTDAPARHLKRIIAGNAPRQLYTDLLLLYTAQRDHLVRDFTVMKYWPAVRQGQLVLSVQQLLDFLWEAERDGRIRTPWSDVVKPKLARGVFVALADFGLVRSYKPGKHEVQHYSPADGTLVYLAYLLRGVGVTDSFLAQHPSWALFGLQPVDVLNRLDALSSHGWFILQRAGDVVRISWQYEKLEEVVDALSR